MSGFEHYPQELASLDHEIRHYAAICAISLDDPQQLASLQADTADALPARQTLRGLLALRIKVEIELAEQGFRAPPLSAKPEV